MVIALTGIVWADQPVRAVPETQTLGTVTTAEVVGLTMETDAGAWTLTNDPDAMLVYTSSTGIEFLFQDAMLQQLVSSGGSYTKDGDHYTSFTIPQSLLNQQFAGATVPYLTWSAFAAELNLMGYSEASIAGGIHTGTLDPGQVQYTTVYDATILAQSGTTSFIKSMNINTGNKVARARAISMQRRGSHLLPRETGVTSQGLRTCFWTVPPWQPLHPTGCSVPLQRLITA